MRFLAIALLAVTGCENPNDNRLCLNGCPQQSAICKSMVDCYEATGTAFPSLLPTYGTRGECWGSSLSRSMQCNETCAVSLDNLITRFPDAGCTVPQ